MNGKYNEHNEETSYPQLLGILYIYYIIAVSSAHMKRGTVRDNFLPSFIPIHYQTCTFECNIIVIIIIIYFLQVDVKMDEH